MTMTSGRYQVDKRLVRYHLDKKAMGYLYRQMAGHIAGRVAGGELPVNKRLPHEKQLAQEYGVSLGTARAATALLREHGVVFTLPSKGTFVVKKVSEEEAREIRGEEWDGEMRELDR